MENLLALAGIGAVAFVVAFIAAVLSSARVRKHGVLGSIRQEISTGSRYRNPYRG